MPKIGEFVSGVRETSKLGGTLLIWLFQVGLFTWFNYGLVDYCEGVERYSIDIWPLKWRKTIFLGTYKMAHEATRAFNASIFYIGKKICMNL